MSAVVLFSAALLLGACTHSPAPAAKAPPAISAEVAAAQGRLYLSDGLVVPADEWWESGTILFYRWQGDVQMVLKDNVTRIEGQPRPKIVGPVETRSTLPSRVESPSAQRAGTPALSPTPPDPGNPSRMLRFPIHTSSRCPWRTAPQCIHTFDEGTFKAWGEASGVIRKWIWRLFLANPGPAVSVDLRLEFRNASLSNDYVKRCRLVIPATATTEIFGDHTIRESAGQAWDVVVEMEPNAKWC